MNKPIRVLLVDDHPVVRAGLRAILQAYAQIEVKGAAESGEAAMDALALGPIDVILLDLRMPGMSGIDVLRRLQQKFMDIRTIILTGFDLDEEIHRAVLAGARGYLMKDTPIDEIVKAVLRVHAGGTHFPKRIQVKLDSRRLRPTLSDREIEILELVAKGFTNKDIANALHVSPFTVRNHINNITAKLDAGDRTEAAFIAIQTGIISAGQ